MLSTQKYPALSHAGFLERAFALLKHGQEIEMFYAALELRFAFESLMIYHGRASDDDSDTFWKLHWQPKRMRAHLIKEFAPRLDLSKAYEFSHGFADPNLTMGYFSPVTEEFIDDYGRLADYLHAQWFIRMNTPDRAWYKEAHAFLSGFAQQMVPHVYPENSLITSCAPNIKHREVDAKDLEALLRKQMDFSHI